MSLTFSIRARNAKVEALADLLNGGSLELCEGVPPSTPETAIQGYAPLARLAFASPAFHPARDGTCVAYPLTAEEAAPAAGLARWFRCRTATGDPVVDGTIGTGNAPLVLSSMTILVGTRVTISSLRLTEPKG